MNMMRKERSVAAAAATKEAISAVKAHYIKQFLNDQSEHTPKPTHIEMIYMCIYDDIQPIYIYIYSVNTLVVVELIAECIKLSDNDDIGSVIWRIVCISVVVAFRRMYQPISDKGVVQEVVGT